MVCNSSDWTTKSLSTTWFVFTSEDLYLKFSKFNLGDLTGAWAQGNRANDEFIIVEYDRPVYPEQIDIYETYNPGAVIKISARNGMFTTLSYKIFVFK